MIYIRTDMNTEIATGHMMRCIAIADAIAALGERVTFILADNQASQLLEQRGYPAIILGTRWNDKTREIPSIMECIINNHIHVMLVDSYQVTNEYMKSISQMTKVYYIDDLGEKVFPVKGIICYMNYYNKFNFSSKYSSGEKLMLGTKYTPLRQEFKKIETKSVSRKINSLLILSGGTDPYNFIWEFLERLDIRNYEEIWVICGRYYEKYQEIVAKYSCNKNVKIRKAIDKVAEYMLRSDVAISAGGTTLYELCACGTPTVTYSFADNQLENVKSFEQQGLMLYAGDLRKDCVIDNALRILKSDFALQSVRQKIAQKMQHLVDGYGASRIAEELIKENKTNDAKISY